MDAFGDESESISKLADQRVSNAVTINNKLTSKMKDMFIKKILKEGEEPIPEADEGAAQAFDIENQATRPGDQIEMTRQTVGRASDPLLNPLLELDDQRIQGQGSQGIEEQKIQMVSSPDIEARRRKAINPRV